MRSENNRKIIIVILLAVSVLALFLVLDTAMLRNDKAVLPVAEEIFCEIDSSGYLTEEGFLLSVGPGVYDEPFRLMVSIPLMPDAIIYYTIDGNEPQPEEGRVIIRGNTTIQVSGRLPESGYIDVLDRSGPLSESILTYHSRRWNDNIIPDEGAQLLRGTAFRFRGFINGVPVTEMITATYIIAPDAASRFANRPIVAVTAPYEDFIYIYSHNDLWEVTPRRRIFYYEYFDIEDEKYTRMFHLPGSSSLGGGGSRIFVQRTINTHFSRGDLDGVIHYPVFSEGNEIYRWRLWNGGNAFAWDHMRDAFAQTASSGLNVPFQDNNLAIKFVNGEYWGFISIREHSSNDFFVTTKTGIPRGNVGIVDRRWRCLTNNPPFTGGVLFHDEVAEGDTNVVWALYSTMLDFIDAHDFSTDYARERLFDEFFCQENFMDYLISNTFFANSDWPYNNIRLFRALAPCPDLNNPYEDGRWRFILHDMDMAPHYYWDRYEATRFQRLLDGANVRGEGHEMWFNDIFLVFNNRAFVEAFRERALYILENDFHPDRLLALHEEFTLLYLPLLPEMYERFPIRGTVEDSLINFENHNLQLRNFLIERDAHYREQLDNLLERLE